MSRSEFSVYQNGALLITRIIIAAVFFYAAYAKLFIWSGSPEEFMAPWLVLVTKMLFVVEPMGGLAVLAGFLTRWAAAGLSVIMLGAIYVMQFVMGFGFATAEGAGWNFPLITLAACILLIAFGAGDWSIDRQFSVRKKSSVTEARGVGHE